MQQGYPSNIPGCDGETFAIDGASDQQLTKAYPLLAEVGQLLEEYAPVWYSKDLRDRLQAALRAEE